MSSKSDDIIRLIAELLTSKIESEEEMSNLVSQVKSQIEDAVISSGESFAMSRVEASYSEAGAMAEHLSGYEAYRTLSDTSSSKAKIKELKGELATMIKKATACADALTKKRVEYAKKLSDEISAQLRYLDLEKAQFCVSVTPLESENGGRPALESVKARRGKGNAAPVR